MEKLLSGTIGKLIAFAIGAIIFAIIQPKLVELLDAIFIGLAGLGTDATNTTQLSNTALVIIAAIIFWLMKPPTQRT